MNSRRQRQGQRFDSRTFLFLYIVGILVFDLVLVIGGVVGGEIIEGKLWNGRPRLVTRCVKRVNVVDFSRVQQDWPVLFLPLLHLPSDLTPAIDFSCQTELQKLLAVFGILR